ncbi:unnamed protein product [Haemonchus placei]|uniref:One cut domain family member n=1 Tax=Haemonchus placei TaxID=6290 RepID=A0A0N4W8P8_HAEPC|nr:unnamed protein product [Haemonchus placei]
MEPPAVTSCNSQNSSNGMEKRRQAADYLQIDPSSTFINNATRNFEDLPENFLDTISPQQSSQSLGQLMNDHANSPQLAPLAPMSIGSDQRFILFRITISLPRILCEGIVFHFGTGPAGLLSPLHLDSHSRRLTGNSEFARHVYIKVRSTNFSGRFFYFYYFFHQEFLHSRLFLRLLSIVFTSQVVKPLWVSAGRRVYSTKDSNDPLNAEIDDDIYIDTKELCKRIAYELKQHSIPQAIFAERILCRSQGTLSDLLRNPKPWNKLKSGRETFRRMFNWVQQPLAMRLGILDMYKQGGKAPAGCGMSPPTPAQNVRHASRRSLGDSDQPSNKRPRLVFTDIQKRTLQAIFKETQRPSREMQQTIAEHLRLDLSTVANFFMNARRRSRIGPNSDEPQPYQQVRPISPPPDSPPTANSGSGPIGNGPPAPHPRNRRQPASMQHVEATVSNLIFLSLFLRFRSVIRTGRGVKVF